MQDILIGDKLYRADVVGSYVHYFEFLVTGLTPKGFWYLGPLSGGHRWMHRESRKATFTKELALENLRRRKLSHVRHARRRLQAAEEALKVVSAKEPAETPKLKKLTHVGEAWNLDI